ncbi:hypothetical protein DCAR_0208163 [Daucus carota subsp. sativus]|uniref:Uncharacterized protein n=1 Tax=Daucus carota subsp. sativus TaxID=79200 RepID=A0A162AVB1_DAUCS|nr:PREDICTED: protein ASPARTIC PROTEASE IN GUARD CELL 1 [Daucus carota subsp. sativus]WOG88928.1 hypothetical protein DCAR_0208163 [Daucus carota subsp. sativus]
MAQRVSFLFFLLVAISFTSVLSRNLPLRDTTTLLDVSASIHKTLSFNSQLTSTLAQIRESSYQPSAPLTLELHPRSSIHKPTHSDYKELTLARLGRDSLRVNSLQARLDLAIHGVSKSDLKPVYTELAAEDLEVPIISGTSQGSGEYFTRLGVGHPPSQLYMVLDTGSDVNWLQCAPCADCYQQTDPIFEPSLSSSYAPLTCNTKQCKSLDVFQCRNDTCLYEVSYGDGSYTVGDFVTETVTFGGSASVNNVAIGCGHSNEGLFVGAAGLIGLGGGSLSFPSQINAKSFSYCLVDRDSDSASTLEFDSVIPPNAVTAPLVRNDKLNTYYYIGLTGLSVAGEMLKISESTFQLDNNGEGGVIIDSGTAVTRLQNGAYYSLRDAFKKGTKDLPSTNGVALFDTCYDLSTKKSVEVPTVSFHFSNGKQWSLPAKNYLIPVDSAGTFCLAFAPTPSALSIVGNVQQQGTRVSYDLGNSLIGFTENKC